MTGNVGSKHGGPNNRHEMSDHTNEEQTLLYLDKNVRNIHYEIQNIGLQYYMLCLMANDRLTSTNAVIYRRALLEYQFATNRTG